MYNYEIIEHVENTYSEGSEMAMSLTEIFRNDGKEEGARTRIKYGRNDY
ncbi:hypothetical protein JOD18_002550 [Gracilibacillus alcaliphilus]|nr:hypothetical protein [Gracilibacillus alcaliphilus]